jgi:hypothetical protein
MKSLVREHFLDLTWDSGYLDAAARFWLRLYEIAATKYGYSAPPHCGLELRLSGFPQAERESLQRELERRTAAYATHMQAVRLLDPDTLSFSTGLQSGPEALPAGLGLSILSGAAFEGLVVDIRFNLVGQKQVGRIDIALVIVGELSGGKLLVKSVARCYAGAPEDFWRKPVPGELEWVVALDEFRESGSVNSELTGWLSPPSSAHNWRWLNSLVIHTAFGRPRLWKLLFRGLTFTAISVAWAVLWYLVMIEGESQLVIPAIVATAGPELLWEFLAAESKWLFSYQSKREEYAKQREQPLRYMVLTPDQTAKFTADPAIRKYSADLNTEGFVLVGDVVPTTVPDLSFGYRIFRAPDGFTYLVLICSRKNMWPANIQLEAQTFFQGGGRVDSMAGEEYGYLRHPRSHDTLHCVFPAVSDPVQFYWKHTAAVEAFALERSLIPARHERIEEYVRRQEVISEEEYQYFRARPYSWRDHLRWYFQWPRRKQRG